MSDKPSALLGVLRSIGAVLAGFVLVVVLSEGTDAVLRAAGIFPPLDKPMTSTGLFLLALAYRTVWSVAGCWLAARLAPSRPMRHALILGGIGFVLSLIGVVVGWNLGPHWYPIALVVLALPGAWLGGRLALGAAGRSPQS